MRRGKPEISDTDQGSQFTRRLWGRGIRIGGGDVGVRWTTFLSSVCGVKYGGICLNEYKHAPELQEGLRWFGFYDEERPLTALPEGTTPRGRMKSASFFEP